MLCTKSKNLLSIIEQKMYINEQVNNATSLDTAHKNDIQIWNICS